jgi:hypothetical protein
LAGCGACYYSPQPTYEINHPFWEKVCLPSPDGHYPEDWKVRIILDNHSAHISKETMRWLKTKPNRLEFAYTPQHASWLNIIDVFFSKMSRAFLRSLRVSSKSELKQRIAQYLQEVNASPVVFRWKYKLDEILL